MYWWFSWSDISTLGLGLDIGPARHRESCLPGEGHLSQLGHPLQRQASLCLAPSCRVARQDQRTGVRRRAESYYQQLDALRSLRREVRRDLLAESKKHKVWRRLCPRFHRAVRSGRRCCWAFCRPRTVFAPSDSCGLTAVWAFEVQSSAKMTVSQDSIRRCAVADVAILTVVAWLYRPPA